MAFDKTKDVEIFKEKLESGLLVTVNQYNGGTPKIQIGPREKEVGGETQYWKAGRLTFEEYTAIAKLQKKIKEAVVAAGGS